MGKDPEHAFANVVFEDTTRNKKFSPENIPRKSTKIPPKLGFPRKHFLANFELIRRNFWGTSEKIKVEKNAWKLKWKFKIKRVKKKRVERNIL